MRIRSANGRVELWMYGYVGKEITAASVVAALKSNPREVYIHLNSDGGDLVEGNVIYNLLTRNSARVVVEVDGVAASAASLIAMAGDEIRIASNAMMMIHEPWGAAEGDAGDLIGLANVLTKCTETMAQAYAARSGLKLDAVLKMMAAETWMTAQEAVSLGFANTITSPAKVAAMGNLARFKNTPRALLGIKGAGPMDPKLIREALDALIAGDAEKCAELLKGIIASAAGAETETETEAPPEDPLAAEEDPMKPTEEEKAIAACARKLTGKSKPEEVQAALTGLGATKSAHSDLLAEVTSLKAHALTADLRELIRANPKKIASKKLETLVLASSSVAAAAALVEALPEVVASELKQKEKPPESNDPEITEEDRLVAKQLNTPVADILAFKKKKLLESGAGA